MFRLLPATLPAIFLCLCLSLLFQAGPPAEAAESVRPGSYVTVSRTEGYALKLRHGPSPTDDVQILLPGNTVLRVLEGPRRDSNGWDWYRITGFDKQGSQGWSVGYFLSPVANAVLHIPRLTPKPPFRILARVTAYNGVEFGNPYGGRTRIGTMVRRGVVASDPSIIPLGSEMVIDGLDGVFVAEDTGSGVWGPHIDVYMPTYEQALEFGSRWSYVTVLGRPYER